MSPEKNILNNLEPVIKPPKEVGFLVQQDAKLLTEEIKKRIRVDSNITKLVFIGVTNRTNTGALATGIGRAPTIPPITRHIQPVKAIARQIMSERGINPSTPLKFLRDKIKLAPGINLVKETIGPNAGNAAEWLDGLNLFINKGVPTEKICFIPTFRDPLDTISSWKRMWKWEWKDFPFESFNHSFETTTQLIKRCGDLGIITVPYIHEFLNDFSPEIVMKRILGIIGLPFSKQVVNWNEQNSVNDADPYFDGNIIKYDLPPNDWIQGSLSVTHGGRGGLHWEPPLNALTQEELDLIIPKIRRSIEIYMKIFEESRKQLGLEVK